MKHTLHNAPIPVSAIEQGIRDDKYTITSIVWMKQTDEFTFYGVDITERIPATWYHWREREHVARRVIYKCGQDSTPNNAFKWLSTGEYLGCQAAVQFRGCHARFCTDMNIMQHKDKQLAEAKRARDVLARAAHPPYPNLNNQSKIII